MSTGFPWCGRGSWSASLPAATSSAGFWEPETGEDIVLTLGIVKPDAVASGKGGKVIAHLEAAGFRIRAARMVRLSRSQAEAFYEVHRGRPFYDSLVGFMTSGPCI